MFGVRSFGIVCRTPGNFLTYANARRFLAFSCDCDTVRHLFVERCANGYTNLVVRETKPVGASDNDKQNHSGTSSLTAPRSSEEFGNLAPVALATYARWAHSMQENWKRQTTNRALPHGGLTGMAKRPNRSDERSRRCKVTPPPSRPYY